MKIFLFIFTYVFIVGYYTKQYCMNTYTVGKGIEKQTPKGKKTSKKTSKKVFSEKLYSIPFVTAMLVVAVPLIFMGLRTDFNDTMAYIAGYEKVPTSFTELVLEFDSSKGVFWLIYEWVIKTFVTDNASYFLLITAIIQMAAVVKVYRKYSIDYCYSILLFFLSCSFLNIMSGTRQFFALSLILFFADWIFEDKPYHFAVIVILAAFIHVSAIIWLPVVFIVRGKPGNIKTILLIFAVILAVLYLNQFTSFLSDSLEGTLYEGYTNQFAEDDGANIMHSVIAAVPLLLWILGKGLVDKEQNHTANILINISIVGFAMNVLAHFTSGILIGRMPIYFTVFNFILYPWLFKKVFDDRSEVLIRYCCILGYFAYALYYMYSMNLTYISSVLNISY